MFTGNLPRERLLQYGEQSLSNEELLAIILRTGTHGCPVLELAHQLLRAFNNSLTNLCCASVVELCKIQGIGQAKALELCAAFALARRLSKEKAGIRPEMKVPAEIAEYMYAFIGDSMQEEFHILMLDTQLCLIRSEQISRGLLDRSLVHPREVFRPAIREACASIILCHNHPSGHLQPSQEDMILTRHISAAGALLGIEVLDHIIIDSNNQSRYKHAYYSFSEHKIMPRITEEKKA